MVLSELGVLTGDKFLWKVKSHISNATLQVTFGQVNLVSLEKRTKIGWKYQCSLFFDDGIPYDVNCKKKMISDCLNGAVYAFTHKKYLKKISTLLRT